MSDVDALLAEIREAVASGRDRAIARRLLTAQSQNQALQEDKDELYAEREEDARRIAALQERAEKAEAVVIRTAQVPCVLLQADPDAATCCSPVAGEGRPRDRWCLYCIARNALSPTQETDPE